MSGQAPAQTFLVPSAIPAATAQRAVPRAAPARTQGSLLAGLGEAGLLAAALAGPLALARLARLGAARRGAALSRRRRAVLPPLRARGGEEPCKSEARAGAGDESEQKYLEYLEGMQGMWEDNVGLTIQVVGNQVHFNDGSGIWKIALEGAEVTVRGTRLLGMLPGVLHWETQNGGRWEWSRMSPLMLEDAGWVNDFIEYKTARVHLRRKLAVAVEAEMYEMAGKLQKEWVEGAQFREGCSLQQQARLLVGKHYVPGTVIRFGKRGTRGVIIGCEPWVSAAAARRIASEPLAPEQRLRPLYHVLVDSRDAQGDGSDNATAFVQEQDVMVCEEAFPLRGAAVEQLMVPCDGLRAYVPSAKLEEHLQRQRDGLPLVLWQ